MIPGINETPQVQMGASSPVSGNSGGLGNMLMAGLSGGLNLLGGGLSAILGGNSASQQEQFQSGQVQQQEQFQEMMSNTAYQRATQSMEAAGLNPMLAYSQGGASTPSGSSASGTQFTPPNIAGGATSSAIQAMQTGQQMDLQQAQIDNTAAKTGLLEAQTDSLTSSAQSSAVSAKADTAKDTADAKPYQTWFGQNVLPWWDVLSGHVNNSAKAVQNTAGAVDAMAAE